MYFNPLVYSSYTVTKIKLLGLIAVEVERLIQVHLFFAKMVLNQVDSMCTYNALEV